MEEFKDCGEIELKIEELEEQEPPKGTILHNEWKEKMNELFGKYNEFVQFCCYKLLK